MRRADRLFQIIERLRRRGVVTARALAEHLKVSEPTIYRDISDLIASQAPIEGAAGIGYSLIAAREGVSDSYVRHLVPLALLAPSVVESICTGRQDVCLSAERLKTTAGLPIEWGAQKRLLAD